MFAARTPSISISSLVSCKLERVLDTRETTVELMLGDALKACRKDWKTVGFPNVLVSDTDKAAI